LERGDSSAVGRGRTDHDQQHRYHHAPTVKPEAATAVVELLMMGVRWKYIKYSFFLAARVDLYPEIYLVFLRETDKFVNH
jgi:hypothetical protein